MFICFFGGAKMATYSEHKASEMEQKAVDSFQFPCQTNKKRGGAHAPPPYEKSVHAVTFSSHIMNNIRPRDIINNTRRLDAVGLLELNDFAQRLPAKVSIDRQAAERKLDPLDCSAFGAAF